MGGVAVLSVAPDADVWPSGYGAAKSGGIAPFAQAPECCMGEGLTRRLRRWWLVFEDPNLCSFLSEFIRRVVVASTFVERRFAVLLAWCRARQGILTVHVLH